MFTVKHIANHCEDLYTAQFVKHMPVKLPAGYDFSMGADGNPSIGSIELILEDDSAKIIDHGTVYVMNDMGKTVAKYALTYYEPRVTHQEAAR